VDSKYIGRELDIHDDDNDVYDWQRYIDFHDNISVAVLYDSYQRTYEYEQW